MSFTLQNFSNLRPYCYHSTSRRNIETIRKSRKLLCAAHLMQMANETRYIAARRRDPIGIRINGEDLQVQTQRPLLAKNIDFKGGWNIDELVECLNEKVFLWPGKTTGPIKNGIKHFEGNDWNGEKLILRFKTQTLFDIGRPFFCHYNSGSPRCSGGKPSPRGPDTFLSTELWTREGYTPSDVVELVFERELTIPTNTEFSNSPDGPWQMLFDDRTSNS